MADRLMSLTGADNFRDLGGYPTLDGHETRWGRVFRSDALTWLTADDVARLTAAGITTVVDLRGTWERQYDSGGPLLQAPIRGHHHPIVERPVRPAVGMVREHIVD